MSNFKVYVLDSMEGNSNLGVPVYSNFGKMNNYQYLALSPIKPDLQTHVDTELNIREQLSFKVHSN